VSDEPERPRRASMEGRPSEPEGALRPMSTLGAVGWTFLATALFFFAWSTAIGLRDAAKDDLVTGAVSQLVGYGFSLFLLLRVHAPETSIRRVLGLRATHPGFYVAGLLLGVGLYAPIDGLYELVEQRFPSKVPDTLPALWEVASRPRRVAMALSIALIGPFVEEVFFRGALFRPLARRAERIALLSPSAAGLRSLSRALDGEPDDEPAAPMRRAAAAEAVIVSAALFALVHIEWQKLVPLFVMGLVLGLLRARSGSIVPSILLHCAFNAVALAQLATGRDIELPLYGYLVLATTSVAMIVFVHFVSAKTARAELARGDEP